MVTDLVTVDARVSVKKAVRVMNDFSIGCLPVTNEGKIAGMLTERDVLVRIVVEGRDPEKTLVGDVMSKPLIVVKPEATVEEAVETMFKNKVKKLPVVENEKLIGLVTFTDIARIQPLMTQTIRELTEKYDVPKRMEKAIHYYIT
jgi:CBS domain-containing protein